MQVAGCRLLVGRWSLSHVARGTSHVAGAAGAASAASAAGGACAAGAAGAAGAAAGAGGAGGCGGAGGEGIFMYTHTSMQIMKYDYAYTKEHQSISA